MAGVLLQTPSCDSKTAGHSFASPSAGEAGTPGLAYNAKADARSWHAMLRLVDETINAQNKFSDRL
jgi:hypothetical protein